MSDFPYDGPYEAIVTRARRADEFQGSVGPDDRVRVQGASNERLTTDVHKNALTGIVHIQFGRIVYAVPGLHWYRVTMDQGGSDIACCRMTECALQPMGVRDVGVYPPGTPVMVLKPEQASIGYILGAIPDIISDGNKVHPDWISQGSAGGYKREGYYTSLFSQLEREGGMIDFSDGRPLDASCLGEWGRFSDLGGGMFIDPFMVFMRQNEVCGLWLHYFDSLTKLAGWNLDIRTAISELSVRDDEGEGDHYHGFTAYPWEALGALVFGTQVNRVVDDAEVQYTKPYGKYEPLHDDQQPIYRTEEYHGYLGQGFMRQVGLLPQQESGVNRYSSEVSRAGVFREQVGFDGSWGVQSAHSIVIAKRCIIPWPKRIKLHEDKSGDTLQDEPNYKFAGIHGEAPEHKINDIAGAEDTELPSLRSVAGLLDFHAHAFNWKGLHPFHYHKKDYNLPDEDGVHASLSSLQRPINFTELFDQMWLTQPVAKKLYVDHRYKEVSYYETTASLSILPDGAMVQRDGSASSISMVGGNILLSCPGDIIFQPGKSVINYAGDDIILRANKSIDITANKGDVHVKAEVNLDMLAGNNGRLGRLLLENQAAGPIHGNPTQQGEDVVDSGICFKARNAEVYAWARDIYLRTGGGNVAEGDITLDSAKGNRDIRSLSRNFIRHINTADMVAFPEATGKKSVYALTESNVMFGQRGIEVFGNAIFQGSIICDGNIAVKGGHIATEKAAKGFIFVGALQGDGLASVNAALSSMQGAQQELRNAMDTDYIAALAQRWHAYPMAGSDGVIKETEFSPRNQTQLNTANFKLPIAYWQQLALETGAATNWEEKVIIYHGEEMMPHPGKAKWADEQTLLSSSPQLFDGATGLEEPRGEAYEDVTLSDWTKQVPNKFYPVLGF